jgi:hypothetical protein
MKLKRVLTLTALLALYETAAFAAWPTAGALVK